MAPCPGIRSTAILRAALFLVAGAGFGQAQTALESLLEAIPQAYEPVVLVGESSSESLQAYTGGFGQTSLEPVSHPQFDSLLRVEIVDQPDAPPRVAIQTGRFGESIATGEWVLVSFYARAGEDTEEGVFKSYIQRNDPEWIGLGELGSTLTGEWNRFVVLGQAEQDFEADSINWTMHLGLTTQTVEVGGLAAVLLNDHTDPRELPISPITYLGMNAEAPWRTEARERIQTHRMGTLALQVLDAQGHGLKGARVHVRQMSHDYPFGSFFQSLMVEDLPEATQYAEWFQANFNAATNPVYWADWGWERPDRREDYIAMAAWLQDNQIPTRGHVLIYPGVQFAPQALMDLSSDPEAFQAHILEHLEEIVPLMKDLGVKEYDVTNELRQLKDFTDIVGMEGVVEWFQKVHELDPEARLYLNENSILSGGGMDLSAQDHLFETIQTLLDRGAPLHGIGMQGHFSGAATNPERLWSILDRFATFGLPIRITEYDMTTRDEEGQARYDADFYTAIFAHPATAGLTRWGFYEPEMWRPQGAIINTEGEYKPNGLAQRDLLFHQWWTRATRKTNSDGRVSLPAFFGQHEVTITKGDLSHTLEILLEKPPEGQPPIQILTLPFAAGSSWLDIKPEPDGVHLAWPSLSIAQSYTVQTSTDLQTWTDWETLVSPPSLPQLQTVYGLPGSPRFFRVRFNPLN